jgi:hypothetical protein
MPKAKEITGKQRDGLLRILEARFEAHMHRHAGLEWTAVQARVESNSAKLWTLNEMEQSGGEPDVVGIDEATGECIFVDCSAQSPRDAAAYVTIAKRWRHGRSTNRRAALLTWPMPWVPHS